ncbi:caspase family protein [Larkinella sp.]|uniref:caspase family protein n=1 Tax=Larkinella sp. TaxID=2034517 RepID=UPI003BA8F781
MMKLRLSMLSVLMVSWLLCVPVFGALAEPPVAVVVKTGSTHDLTSVLPVLQGLLRERKYSVVAGSQAGEAGWRIELSCLTDKCPLDASVPRVVVKLEAFDPDLSEPVAVVRAPHCSVQSIDQAASQAVTILFKGRGAYERDREAFFRQIGFHFSGKQAAKPVLAVRDTVGPQIDVISPSLPEATRGMARLAKAKTGEVTIIGRVTDPSKVDRLTLNGQSVALDEKGTFQPVVQLTDRGDYPILMEAYDAVGNVSRLEFTLTPQMAQRIAAAKSAVDKRLALVIGNGGYKGVPALGNPVNDADAMASSLTSLGFRVIKCTNVDRIALISAINAFGEVLSKENYTVGMVYYAGHGVQRNGLNYLVPVEVTKQSDVESECVGLQHILNKMEAANTRVNILVMDACRNDPFVKPVQQRDVGNSGGPASIKAPTGTLIAFATAPGSTAADGTGKNGTYTESLLQHIQKPNVSIESVFRLVRTDVMQKTNNEQIPWESTSLTGDEFYFRR